MPVLRRLSSMWKSLVYGSRMDRELDEELRSYLDGLIEKKIRSGLDPAAARRRALIEMGGISQVRAEVRGVRAGAGLAALVQDVPFALRCLIRRPSLAVVAIVTFALGIGANTAIFSVVNSVLIRPLPYRDSSRLVFVWSDMSSVGYPRAPLSGPELKDLRERASLFSGFGAIWANTLTLTSDRNPEQLRIGLVTANFFQILGVSAQIGRIFDEADDAKGAPPAILLSYSLWQRRYGGDVSIVGQTVLANGAPTKVIGVMPAAFRLLFPADSSVPEELDAWVPLGAPVTNGPRGQQFLRVVGRMKPGVSFIEARDQVSQTAVNLSREFTSYGSAGLVLNLVGLQSDGVRLIRPGLLTLLAGVILLLMTACLNVASLLIARAASRTRETALRLAVGACHRQVARQCLVEGLVLAGAGAIAGIGFGEIALRVLLAFRPAVLSRLSGAAIDGTVLVFTAAVALIWGALFSFAPMVEVFRTDVVGGLLENRRSATAGRHRLRMVLVTLQVAFCVALLVGAGLMIRTFVSIQRVDPGYRSGQMLSFRINPSMAKVQPGAAREVAINEFQQHLQSELSALPGVTGVGSVSHLPFDNIPNWGGAYVVAGMESSKPGFADYRSVSPGYFEAVDARRMSGRFFTEADDTRAQPVAIVDDLLARKAWPGKSALGQQITVDPFSTGRPTDYVSVTVVGVVHHMRLRSFIEELSGQVYLPIRQFRRPATYVVRTSGDPIRLVGPTRDTVRRLDPQLPVYDVHLVEDNLIEARSGQRFTTMLATAFAAVTLALTVVGVYGLVSYSVNARRYEFGVRVALGAKSRQIVHLVLREGIPLLGGGLFVGVWAAAGLAYFLRTQLYGVTASDVATYAAAVSVIAAASLFASWLPARRAALSDPLTVMRTH